MDDNINLLKSLLKSSINYGAAEIDLIKLKTLHKTTDVISGLIPPALVFFVLLMFLLFLSFGLANWLGQIMGNIYYGYFMIAAFYALVGILMHLLLHKWIKRKVCDYLVRQIFK